MTPSAADLIGAMLGTLFLALGLAAGAAAAFRSARRDRALLWFGVFTALYGLRLIVRSDTVQTEFPFSITTWDAIDSLILAVQEGEVADPGAVLTRMNHALYGRFEKAYVTAVFALIDPAAGTLTYASAGHPSPLLRRSDGRVETLDERGIVLGFMPDVTYGSAVVRGLAAGDRVVFYSDGITEAARADGEFFGDREFQQIVATGDAQTTEQFMASLIDAARQWVGADFEDDVTVVVVDWV